MIHKHPNIATEILSELASRLRKTHMQIEGLAQMNVASKVSKTILHLVVEQGLETVEAYRCRSDQHTRKWPGWLVRRVLSRFEKQGYIRCDGWRILVFK